MIRIDLLTQDNENDWESFVGTYVDKEYAYSLKWRRLLKDVFAYDDLYYLIWNDHDLAGLLPVFMVKSKILKDRLISIPFADMGGFYFAPFVSDAVKLEAYHKVKERLGHDLGMAATAPFLFEVRGPHQSSNDFLIRDCHFLKTSPYVKFIIKLDVTWAAIEDGYHRSVRRILQKPSDELVIDAGGEECLPGVYAIYVQEMKRLGSFPLPLTFFAGLFRELGRDGGFTVFTASYAGKIIGAMTLIAFKDTIYADLIMSDVKFNYLFPKHYLYAESIKFAWQSKQYKYYDFSRTRRVGGVFEQALIWGGKVEDICYYYPTQRDRERCFLDPSQNEFALMGKLIKQCPASILKYAGGLLRRQAGK